MAKKQSSSQSKEVTKVESQALAPAIEFKPSVPVQNTPDMLLAMAIEKGVDMAQLEKLMDLQDRWMQRVAKGQYLESLSAFQAEVPEIKKNKNVNYPSKREGGGNIDYWYAPLGDIDEQIKPFMQKFGLSKSWKIQEFKDSGITKIKVQCFISHSSGHSEMTEMEAEADNSGSKNLIQQKASSIEYMRRYTLISALGLTTADSDVDAQGTPKKSSKPTELPKPDDKQYAGIVAKIKSGEVTLDKVRQHYSLTDEQITELTSSVPAKPVDEATMKIIIKEVRGGVTIEEIKNKFTISADQEKALETIVNAKEKMKNAQ